MSLYAQYIKEHRGDGIIETDTGFATYRLINDNKTIYIVDIYIVPEAREIGAASKLADEVVKIGKLMGCTELIGTVCPQANNPTTSLKVLLGYGMKLCSASETLIVFKKEL